jgi:hypothetical protein
LSLIQFFSIEKNDPALNDIELENTLVENEREAVVKTEKVKDRFFCQIK